MPELSFEKRLEIENRYKIPIKKLKWTDNPNTGLALIGGNRGFWVDLTTLDVVPPATIYRESIIIDVIDPNVGLPDPERDDSAAWMKSVIDETDPVYKDQTVVTAGGDVPPAPQKKRKKSGGRKKKTE